MNPRKSAANLGLIKEDQLHRTVAELLEWSLHPETVWTTFPAGWGKLHPATAGRLRGCGLKVGFPDILIFHPPAIIETEKRPIVVGIELKVQGRKPSAAQQIMFPRLRMCGVRIFVCECVDDVILALRKVNIPLRGRFTEYTYGETSDTSAEKSRAAEFT